jgi:hypothetical protein
VWTEFTWDVKRLDPVQGVAKELVYTGSFAASSVSQVVKFSGDLPGTGSIAASDGQGAVHHLHSGTLPRAGVGGATTDALLRRDEHPMSAL